MLRCLNIFFFSVLCINSALYAQQPELLSKQQISQIMGQILDQHVDQKEVSNDLIRNSFRVYIDHFDPERIYLLESEVSPFINMDNAQIQQVIRDYKSNDYSTYEQLNRVIQGAILRARSNRAQIESNDGSLLQAASTYNLPPPDINHNKRTFPADLTQLTDREKDAIIRFIVSEKKRFGNKAVNNPQKLIGFYENYVRNYENQYLYQNSEGQPLTQAEQDNLFVMHVLKALTNALDAHTSFLAPSEAFDMRVRLEKSVHGIGIILKQSKQGEIIVEKIVEGGPAAKSGQIAPGDTLLAIDGKQLGDQPLDEVLNMIRGDSGSTVRLTVQKPNQTNPITVDLTRESFSVNEDRAGYSYIPYENGIIGIIKLTSFYQGENDVSSEADVRRAIQKLDEKGNLKGLILDLRQNSGGFLSQAVKVAGLFVTNGVIVISKYSSGDEKIYRDMDNRVLFNGPLVILTSKATASAAEIVAQALQDYGVALIVGDEQTYGKGTIQSQTVTENQGTSYFKVTVGKYYTVSGKTPQIQGVKADVVVPGILSRENIGEEYLDYSLNADTIPPEYDDPLSDIAPNLKSWYMRYYMPTLQNKRTDWRAMIPVLKEHSAQRIGENAQYQAFLKQQQVNAKTINDLQLNEAVNVVKDMVDLHEKQSFGDVANGNQPKDVKPVEVK